jgi:hypothetical protein
MLQRARAELADERQRCQQVLLELARFEAEKTNMKQEISGWTTSPSSHFVFFVAHPNSFYFLMCLFVMIVSATLTCPAALQAQVGGLEIQAASLSDKCSTLEVIKASATLKRLSELFLLREQLENEREILTLKSVIEQLKQSLDELAAAAQVLLQSRALYVSGSCLKHCHIVQELNSLRSALNEKTVKNTLPRSTLYPTRAALDTAYLASTQHHARMRCAVPQSRVVCSCLSSG